MDAEQPEALDVQPQAAEDVEQLEDLNTQLEQGTLSLKEWVVSLSESLQASVMEFSLSGSNGYGNIQICLEYVKAQQMYLGCSKYVYTRWRESRRERRSGIVSKRDG